MTEAKLLSEIEVEEIEARASEATPAPWMVQDSCSWRRIGTVEPYGDGNVVCPIIQYGDNHPDLLAARLDLEFIVHAREDIPALCQTVKALRAEIGEYEKMDTVPRSRYDVANADWLEARQLLDDVRKRAIAEIERLESQLAAVETENKRLIDNASCELCDQSLYDTHGNQVQPPVCLLCFNNRVAEFRESRRALTGDMLGGL